MICAVVGLILTPVGLFGQSLQATDSVGRTFVYVPMTTMATTICQRVTKDSVVAITLLNMAYMDDTVQLDGIKVHEQVHRDEMQANHALCKPSNLQLLGMETRAYCTEAYFLTRYGLKQDSLYWSAESKLHFQFNRKLPWEQVTGAWYAECGGMLELGKKK